MIIQCQKLVFSVQQFDYYNTRQNDYKEKYVIKDEIAQPVD